jgi:hypothetical protein
MLKIQTNTEGYISVVSAVISIERERLIMTHPNGEVTDHELEADDLIVISQYEVPNVVSNANRKKP